MNILPKKRWHVRTKENIARVKRDEAEAAEKERQEKLRIENADREARLNILKFKSKQTLLDLGIQSENNEVATSEHINLFTDIEHAVKLTNKDHDKEIKEKKEEYEKKIGYLTYLGQDTNEALKKKNWYEVSPSSRSLISSSIKDSYEKLIIKDADGKPKKRELDIKDGELDWKAKQREDPINSFKKYSTESLKMKICPSTSIKSYEKCHKKSKTEKTVKEDKEKKLQKLREARLKREQQEKHKTELFLSGLNTSKIVEEENVPKVKAKYNSQFNPELARQNYR